jgi:hypothetical protein
VWRENPSGSKAEDSQHRLREAGTVLEKPVQGHSHLTSTCIQTLVLVFDVVLYNENTSD